MTTSKALVKAPNLENIGTQNLDYYGLTPEMIQALMAMAIKQNNTQKLLGIQKFENGGEKRKYYLVKRASKKMGYVYQMKLIDPETNDILPTKYSTGTNDLETATLWAERNYKTLLAKYEGKGELTILDAYYSDTSTYWKYEKYDGRKLSPVVMKQRQSFMTNHIVKFLQGQKVRFLSQITPIHIRELKNHLRTEKELTPQTINYNLNSFKKCLLLFRDMGKITTDFSTCVFSVKGSKQAEKARGIYPIDTLKGVFGRKWENGLSKLLCMVIYYTGIRNSEIQRIQFNDIEKIGDTYFLNVRGTKNKNAIRKVPIHDTLYKALKNYVKANGIEGYSKVFQGVYNNTFRQASFDMGSLMGFNESDLLKKGICFYSGRHTFKTLLAVGNAMKIADVSIDFQELFMGHPFNKEKVKGNEDHKEYAYKHLDSDSIGNDLLLIKGKEVLKILNHFFGQEK
jgi:integrase